MTRTLWPWEPRDDDPNDDEDQAPRLDELADDEEDSLASEGFAPAPAPPSTFQTARSETNPSPVRFRAKGAARRTTIPARPLLLPDFPRIAQTTPSPKESTHLLPTVTERDLVILQVLHDYRYLNTSQLKDLFFPSLRATQARVQQLRDLGLIYRWQMIVRPGLTRRHSLLLISPRGARILASIDAEHPATYVERSRQARTYHWRAPHDLGANDFFVWLALESRDLSESGLLYWIGEETMRAHYRQIVTGRRDGIPTPDGHANYLAPDGHVTLEFEWDRGTEPLPRLRQKVQAYYQHFRNKRDADLTNVLFVVPSARRERTLRSVIDGESSGRGSLSQSPSFWVTTTQRLEAAGPLGAIWCPGNETEDEKERRRSNWHAPLTDPARLLRVSLTDMPMSGRGPDDRPEDCIGKPGWWERRPGGGEAL